MKRPSVRRVSRGVLAACFCLCAVSAVAMAGHLEKFTAIIDLPGVDRFGNLDLGHLSPVPFKIVVNTRSGNVLAVGRGRVRNLSGRRQVYRNQATMNPGLIDFPGLLLKRDRYVVDKSGHCRATAVAKVD